MAKQRGHDIYTATRRAQPDLPGKNIVTGDLTSQSNWQSALTNRNVVIHLAARVHVMQEHTSDPLHEFRNANVEATLHLARAAARQGVRRFIYISSIKVNGEATLPGHPFRESDCPHPQDPYAISKWEAESGLQAIAQETGLEVVVLRPPLIYGPGVKGNFARLARIANLPLPLASISNRRDLLHVNNMADAILLCAHHPAAANQTFLVCDGHPVSTPELMCRLAKQHHKACRLWPFPPALLHLLSNLTGQHAIMQRLAGSLEIDAGKLHNLLNWQPPVKTESSSPAPNQQRPKHW